MGYVQHIKWSDEAKRFETYEDKNGYGYEFVKEY